jgi:hypothetical protein
VKITLIFGSFFAVGPGALMAQDSTPLQPPDATERTTEIDRVLDRAAETVRAAKRPEDLDEIIAQLDKLQQKGVPYAPINPELLTARLAAAKNFTREWQEYLSAIQNGNVKRAREILEQLAQTGNVNFVPRSEILRRVRDPIDWEEFDITKAAKEIAGRIKGLDDLNGAVAELEKLKPTRGAQSARYEPSIYAILEAFAPLNNAYNDFKAGLPVPLIVAERKERGFEEVLTRLRAELFVRILPRVLELSPDIYAKPGEGPLPFLRRIAAEAAVKNDYLLVARARVAEEIIQGSAGATEISGERQQAAFFVRAFRQEQAGQFAQAVGSYQAALATGAEVIPAKVIGDRLGVIKAKHPNDYAKGSDPSFAESQNQPRTFNYAVFAPNTLEIYPKLAKPTPFPPPPNRMVVPLPPPMAIPRNTSPPSPSP